MRRALPVIFLGLLTATAAVATTYVRVEKDGTKTYSDRPLPGGHPVEIQPAQTYSAPQGTSTDSSRPREEQDLLEASNFHYAGCSLTPSNDQTFTNPESVPVELMLTPALRYGDTVVLSDNGAEVTMETGTTRAQLIQPVRGSHTVNARITDRSGRTVCDTSTTFHVMRPTLNSPVRQAPPRPPPRPTPH